MSATTSQPTGTPTETRRRTEPAITYTPLADILESDQEFVIILDMPGVKGGDVDITYAEGVLGIQGKVAPRQPAGRTFIRQEYGVGDYERAFEIGPDVNAEAIRAGMKDGVLTLHIPKAEKARVRRIPVQTA